MADENILIADDDEAILELLERMLQDEGYRLHLASDGEQAVKIAKTTPIDLAILDKVMPIMDGMEALKQIKQLDGTIEVLVITGYGDLESLRKMLVDYGAFDYLLKPFVMAEVKNTVRNALQKRESNLSDKILKKDLRNRILELERDFRDKTFQLRESQVKYKNIIEESNDMIVVLQDGWAKFANPMALDLMGRSSKEMMNTPFIEMVHPDDRAIMQKASSPPYIFRALNKDEKTLWLEINSVKTSWEGGPATLNIIRDISERHQADEALRESEERYRTLFEGSRDAIYITTQEGRFVDVNQAFLDLFGYTPEEIKGLMVQEIYADKNDRDRFQEEIEETGFVRDYDVTLQGKAGTELKCMITATVQRAEDGTITGYQGTIRDVSEYKRAEEALTKSREQLRALSAYLQSAREQERTSIAREIHDDLGQSLTALKMDLSWMRKRVSEDQQPLIGKMQSMSELVDMTIGTVKRIITDLRPGLLDDLGLEAAVEWQVEEFEKRTGIKCKARLDIEEHILDPERSTAIFRILQETLTNVLRHSKATEISISLTERDGQVVLVASDNGKGITKKQISQPGSFGLMGIQERAHVFGGNMEIVGVRGKGTTVTVSIPIERT